MAAFKPALAFLLLLPAAWAGYAVWMEVQAPGSLLGADPGEALVLHFGEWALRVVLLALAISSIQRRTGFKQIVRSRRMVGLFAFFYTSLHLFAYVGFLAAFSLAEVFADLTERTYITVGFAAWLILLALSATSTRGWQRRLRRGWKRLHQLVYVAVALALIHFWWLTKDGYAEVVLYTAVFALLMLERLSRQAGSAASALAASSSSRNAADSASAMRSTSGSNRVSLISPK